MARSVIAWIVLGLVPLAGCLGGDTPDLTNGLIADPAGLFDLVCKESEDPLIDPVTGKVGALCNVAVTVGTKPVNEPSIAINPKDPKNLIAGGNDYNMVAKAGPLGLRNAVWTGVYVSKDGGETWKRDFLPGYPGGPQSALTGQTAAGDAAIAFAPDGTAYYAGIAFKRTSVDAGSGSVPGSTALFVSEGPSIFIARSTNGGDSWDHIAVPEIGVGPLVTVLTPVELVALDATMFQDKEYIAVGPDGTVYVTWTSFQFLEAYSYQGERYIKEQRKMLLDDKSDGPIMMIKSTDKGMTWSDPVQVSRIQWNQGSVPAVAPDGTLYVTWAEFTNDAERSEDTLINIVARTSKDKGMTWSDTVVVAKDQRWVAAGHGFRTNAFPSIAIDPASSPHAGRATITWAANTTGDNDIYSSQSMDGGKTWTEPVRVNQDLAANGRHQYFPWVATDPYGVAHVVYYDGRSDPFNERLEVYVASTSDGMTYTERLVSDAPFLADADGFTGSAITPNFLGDYNAIAASSLGVYPLWPDTRTGVKDPGNTDLFLARLSSSATWETMAEGHEEHA